MVLEKEWGSSTSKITSGKDSICLSSHSKWTSEYKSLLFWVLEKPSKNSTIKSRCITDNKICYSYRDENLYFQDSRIQIDNQTNIKDFNVTAKAPCLFPFYDQISNKTYYSCTKKGCTNQPGSDCNNGEYPYFWCAVSIQNNATFRWKNWGICDESCPRELPEDNTMMIIVCNIPHMKSTQSLNKAKIMKILNIGLKKQVCLQPRGQTKKGFLI